MNAFWFRVGVCALVYSSAVVYAQTTPAPVPAAIRSAKTIFISNVGSEDFLFPEPFSGAATRGYEEFYGSLKASGAYTLVDDPSAADLVLELTLTVQNPGELRAANSEMDALPTFRLVILDRRTHYVLWTITQGIGPAVGQKNHDHNFDAAVGVLTDDFLILGGHPVPGSSQPTPELTRSGRDSGAAGYDAGAADPLASALLQIDPTAGGAQVRAPIVHEDESGLVFAVEIDFAEEGDAGKARPLRLGLGTHLHCGPG
jgi:hypothetical protein